MATVKGKVLRISATTAIATVALWALPNQAGAVDAVAVGTGDSALSDASAAMSAAADAAIAALGGKTAAVVLAWVETGSENAFSGLSAKFAAGTKIYGIPGVHLVDQNGRDKKAIVYALAGEIQAAHSLVTLAGTQPTNYSAAGSQVGTALKAIQTKTTDSKLFILLGDQNNPKHKDTLSGFFQGYGSNSAWVVGGSTGKVFADGKVASTSILGILLYGEFDCRFGFEEGANAAAAQTALTNAKDATKTPTFALIFACSSRYGKLGASGLTSEFNYMTQLIGSDVPFGGAHFPGEIGKKNLTATSYATGGAFAVVTVFSRAATSNPGSGGTGGGGSTGGGAGGTGAGDAGRGGSTAAGGRSGAGGAVAGGASGSTGGAGGGAGGTDTGATGRGGSTATGGRSGSGGAAAGGSGGGGGGSTGGASTAAGSGGTPGGKGGATGAAGSGGAGTGGRGGAAGATSQTSGSTTRGTANEGDPGCSCRLGEGSVRGGALGVAIGLLLVLSRRVRRQRRGGDSS